MLATLCVNTTLIAIVGERSKEFALQKSLGAKKFDIIRQISTEILIIAFCASYYRAWLGVFISSSIRNNRVQILYLICDYQCYQLRLYFRY